MHSWPLSIVQDRRIFSRIQTQMVEKKTVGAKRGLLYRTNSSQFLLFVKDIAAVLNKLGLRNMYIVMNNAAIHEISKGFQTICNHGHTTLFIRPLLANVAPYWRVLVKNQKVRKTPLTKNEIMVDYIEDTAKTVTVENYRLWICHSLNLVSFALEIFKFLFFFILMDDKKNNTWTTLQKNWMYCGMTKKLEF